jgi:hypothetical protein
MTDDNDSLAVAGFGGLRGAWLRCDCHRDSLRDRSSKKKRSMTIPVKRDRTLNAVVRCKGAAIGARTNKCKPRATRGAYSSRCFLGIPVQSPTGSRTRTVRPDVAARHFSAVSGAGDQ